MALSLSGAEQEVRLEVDDLDPATASELAQLLMVAGGLASPHGFVIPLLAFRRSAVDLAQLLSTRVELAPDEAVRRILEMHLAEIKARRAAETSVPLSDHEVQAAVTRSGRFARTLTDAQRRDLAVLLNLPNGANFSVPGAGKTTTLFAHYEAMRAVAVVDRLLVVAPKNAFVAWDQEVELVYGAAGPRMVRLGGGREAAETTLKGDPEMVILTYQFLANALDIMKGWSRRHQTYAVLDESHRVKAGRTGVLASAALELAEVSVRRAILSGTPLPQSPEDLRPQLEFLWPGQRIMPDLRVTTDSTDDILADLEIRVRPLYTRTTKNELHLPPLDGPKPISVPLGPIQRELYDLLRSSASRMASTVSRDERSVFRALGRHVVRLLQAASNPLLLTQGELVDRTSPLQEPDGARAWELLRDYARYERPAKVMRVVERAEALVASGSKVLIWSSFLLNLASLESLLKEHDPVVLSGQVATGDIDDDDTREGRIRKFHEDDGCKIMIANPAACGEGISLHHVCHHAIYLDRTFNAAHFLQSVDRIHRLGLPADQVTTVEVVEAVGTIDQTVALRLKKRSTQWPGS